MRKHDFRGMNEGRWTSGSLLEFGDDTYITQKIGDMFYTLKVDKSTVCEFTGAIDRESNMIYEGDVLRRDYESGEESEFFLVKWFEPFSKFVMVDSKGGHHATLPQWNEDCVIIGDIYESPELKEWFDA